MLRRERIGFIFQAFNLIPTLTALENITLPIDTRRAQARPGVARHASSTPSGCATGSTHRPSRAVRWPAAARRRRPRAGERPQIIFADEPTGNLDSRAGAEILGFMRRARRRVRPDDRHGHARPVAASYADRVLFLADGRIVDEMHEPTAERVLERMARFDASNRRS